MRDEFALGAMFCQNLAREISDFSKCTSDESDNSQNVGTLLCDPFPSERWTRSQGNASASEPSVRADAMKKTQMFYSVREIGAGVNTFPMRRSPVGHVKSILTLFSLTSWSWSWS
jgi:hypothetical protein